MKKIKKIHDKFLWILKNKFIIVHDNESIIIQYKNADIKINFNSKNYNRFIAIKGFGEVNILKNFYYGMDKIIFSYNDEYFNISFSYNYEVKIFNFNNMFLKVNNKYISISENGILEKSIDNLPINIFDWSEEEYFYFKLKYC